jgi:hypothetical protein
MTHSPSPWSPTEHGLSVSGLNLWLIDREAFRIQYLEGWEEASAWRKELAYGSLFGAGLEGFIKTKQLAGAHRFIQNEYKAQVDEHGYLDDILWWTKLANHQIEEFIKRYGKGKTLPLSACTDSERNIRVEINLPSGRPVLMNCYLDGEGEDFILENKCRGKWDEVMLSENIKHDMQYNYYLLAYYSESGKLPTKVWYQNCRRPCSFGYRGPAKRKSENQDEFLERIKVHMTENPDYYFYRFIGKPTLLELQQFCHLTLYPIMEAFLDWYEYITTPANERTGNNVHWMTPYGLYNPFTEDVRENFRNYRLTGTTIGLRKRFR